MSHFVLINISMKTVFVMNTEVIQKGASNTGMAHRGVLHYLIKPHVYKMMSNPEGAL